MNPTGQTHVTIEKLVYGGHGLARIGGQVVLTPYVLPGERALITEPQRRACIISIEESSPRRVLPGCEYFGRCGGCQHQHADYSYQLEQKVEVLREVLRRVGKIDPPAEIPAVSGPEWQYRNRTQLHIANG